MYVGLYAILIHLEGESSKSVNVFWVFFVAKLIKFLRVYSMSLFHGGVAIFNKWNSPLWRLGLGLKEPWL